MYVITEQLNHYFISSFLGMKKTFFQMTSSHSTIALSHSESSFQPGKVMLISFTISSVLSYLTVINLILLYT